jgi:hypothetical protein
MCWVKCGNQLGAIHDYRTCGRVLCVGGFVENELEPIEFLVNGFPLTHDEQLEMARYAGGLAPSRPHLRLLHRDDDGVTIQCSCGVTHTIKFQRVFDVFFEKGGPSNRDPVRVWTTEL